MDTSTLRLALSRFMNKKGSAWDIAGLPLALVGLYLNYPLYLAAPMLYAAFGLIVGRVIHVIGFAILVIFIIAGALNTMRFGKNMIAYIGERLYQSRKARSNKPVVLLERGDETDEYGALESPYNRRVV